MCCLLFVVCCVLFVCYLALLFGSVLFFLSQLLFFSLSHHLFKVRAEIDMDDISVWIYLLTNGAFTGAIFASANYTQSPNCDLGQLGSFGLITD